MTTAAPLRGKIAQRPITDTNNIQLGGAREVLGRIIVYRDQ